MKKDRKKDTSTKLEPSRIVQIAVGDAPYAYLYLLDIDGNVWLTEREPRQVSPTKWETPPVCRVPLVIGKRRKDRR